MKLISWNINGFRSLMNRTLLDAFAQLDADVYCFQETKLQAGQGELDLPGFTGIWNYADRPGYSGTAVLTLRTPVFSRFGLCEDETDTQGRVITADLGDFYLVNAYAPNVAADLSRLPERVAWNDALLRHLQALDARKPVILCGDLNAAYNDADLAGKSQGMHVPGFTREERSGMAALLQSGCLSPRSSGHRARCVRLSQGHSRGRAGLLSCVRTHGGAHSRCERTPQNPRF